MTNQLDTIYQLFESTDTQHRVFDMGRRVSKISSEQFKNFEDATAPYPYPLQQKAWLAILFWDKKRSEQHYLWFLKFQLDEQGKLIQATRNHFLAMVIEVLGTQLTGNSENQQKLDNNPYTFKPDQNKLAYVNELIKQQLKQPASVYYEHAQSYLSGAQGWQSWQQVGIQGLADVAARIDTDNNHSIIQNALSHLPIEVLTPLCAQLEHSSVPTHLTEQLIAIGEQALNDNNKSLLINIIRAISNSKANKLRQQLLSKVLASDISLDIEMLIVITGRCWLDLNEQDLRMTFLEQLAALDDMEVFEGLVSDLVAIPAIRGNILASFRSPERSAILTKAIGYLFGQQTQTSQ